MKKIDKTNFKKKELEINEKVLLKLKKSKKINKYFVHNNFFLINGECIEVMNSLISEGICVDHIITDIPYGRVQGLSISGWKKKLSVPKWDIPINNNLMYEATFKISKPNCNMILFSQEPLTCNLINDMNLFEKYSLSNKMIWKKNNHANGFNSKTTPLNYYEEMLLIRKSLDESNCLELRKYFKDLLDFIPYSKKQIIENLGQGLDHCFRFQNRTWYIPSEENYKNLIKKYQIDKFEKFKKYSEIKKQYLDETKTIFNLPKKSKAISNVFEVSKDKKNIHPTQKPLELLENLILIFSKKNDTILDFTCGSGSTGIAAVKNQRKFIGIELDEKFYNEAISWYKKKYLDN